MFYWDSDPNPGPQIPRWAIVLLAAFGLLATAILIARVLGGA